VVIATKLAPIFVSPSRRLEPIAQAEPDAALKVIDVEGEWYLIEYHSRRWGPRRGYVRRDYVRPIATPR
jgi:hypothetical protein